MDVLKYELLIFSSMVEIPNFTLSSETPFKRSQIQVNNMQQSILIQFLASGKKYFHGVDGLRVIAAHFITSFS